MDILTAILTENKPFLLFFFFICLILYFYHVFFQMSYFIFLYTETKVV